MTKLHIYLHCSLRLHSYDVVIFMIQWPVLQPSYERSYDRNPNKLHCFAAKNVFCAKNFFAFVQNILAYWDYDRSYAHSSVIVRPLVPK